MAPRAGETFVSVTVIPEERRVELVRTAEPFTSGEEIAAAFTSINQHIGNVDLSNWVMLTDLRLAKGRNDDQFEAAMRRYRDPLYAPFRRVAVVVETVVGRLQVTRQSVSGGAESKTRVFNDVNAARRWLAAR